MSTETSTLLQRCFEWLQPMILSTDLQTVALFHLACVHQPFLDKGVQIVKLKSGHNFWTLIIPFQAAEWRLSTTKDCFQCVALCLCCS